MNTVIKLDTTAQAHIQAYIEYKNIVGDTDGGKLLSQEEYAKRQRKALEDQKNRIYVTWTNQDDLECRAVGPSSKCFCGHKFRDHDSCNKQKHIHCKMSKCKCKQFEYIPIRGSQDLKCHCKHSYKFHNILTRKCTKKHAAKGTICPCSGFISSFGCACGEPFSSHHTLFETRTERQKAGKRVDNLAMGTGMGCAAMGGITTFSSLLDGVDRMSVQENKNGISDLQLQFMRPKTKLSEEEEMAIYERKYKNKVLDYCSNNPSQSFQTQIMHRNKQSTQNKKSFNANKLKLLKQRKTNGGIRNTMNKQHQNEQCLIIRNNRKYDEMESKVQEDDDYQTFEIKKQMIQIQQKLKDGTLSAAKKYALNRELRIERSKIIRHQRKREQEKRRFEKGL